MPPAKRALALILSLSLAAPSAAAVRVAPLKSLPVVNPGLGAAGAAAPGASGSLALPVLSSVRAPAPLVLAAQEHLSLFRTQPPAMALSTLLSASAEDPAAAVVLQAAVAQAKDPAAHAVIAAKLGSDAALQLETIAEALPKLANTDRKLRAALSEVRKAVAGRGPELSPEKIAALFDGGTKASGNSAPVYAADGQNTLPAPNGLKSAEADSVSAGTPAADVPPAPKGKVRALNAKRGLKKLAASIYRPILFASRAVFGAAGRAYRNRRGLKIDEYRRRWGTLEDRYKTGQALSETPAEAAARLSAQTSAVGGALISPMIGVSGMSFPQLSAQSHLSLLYINLKLAKEHGARILHNTGEGGPRFHLAMLEGDRAGVLEEVVRWNLENGQFKAGSWDHARIESFVDSLMKSREAVFKEFSAEDLSRAQIVAQFGSGLNGVRGPGMSVDFDKLKRVADSPFTAMVQYKLKQAAKRGAKVDPRKVDDFVAALRDLPRSRPFKSPELNPEMSSYESIAALILKTRAVTDKPVSLKFGIGDPWDPLESTCRHASLSIL